MRLIVYPHLLAGPEEVVEWGKGTLLTEYERHLPAKLFARFVADYRERLLARLEPARPYFFTVQTDTLLGAAVRLRRT